MSPHFPRYLLLASLLLSACDSPKPAANNRFRPSTMSMTASSVSMTGTRSDGTTVTTTGRNTAEAMSRAQSVRGSSGTRTTAASSPKTAADLKSERQIREKIKKGQFIPGYQGGPVSYSNGDGVHTFTP